MCSKTRTSISTMPSSAEPDGYRESIERGLRMVRSVSRLTRGTGTTEENLSRLRTALDEADAIVVGAGAGLSTSAGLTYSGARFFAYFSDFAARYGIRDMYSGGFYPFPDQETYWAWWSRHIYFNRYIDAPRPVYPRLLKLLEGRDSFVVTTNVDHQFQRAGFDKARLFYTQGDYGLFQAVHPKSQQTYENEAAVLAMLEAQGFVRDETGTFRMPENGKVKMRIPTELIPTCPDGAVTMNLRADDSFVEDAGWHAASRRYGEFLNMHETGKVLYLELGVGSNTPVIIKYPFWQRTAANPDAVYACLNFQEACCPVSLTDRSICIDGDIGDTFARL